MGHGTLKKGKNMNGNEFKATRAYHNLTVNEAGEIFDVNPRSIRRWENGTAPIPQGIIEEWAEVAQSRAEVVEQLLTGADPQEMLDESPAYHPALIWVAWGEMLTYPDNFGLQA